MDQEPARAADTAPAQVSQWLFTASPRRRARTFILFAQVIVLVALAVVGLLALTSAFFPQ